MEQLHTIHNLRVITLIKEPWAKREQQQQLIYRKKVQVELTKTDNDSLGRCMYLTMHSDDQTEGHICDIHYNALHVEAAKQSWT